MVATSIIYKTKKQIPFQLEHRGLSAVQNLLVQVNVKAKSSITLLIQKGKPETFVTKTYARFVPERKDDFAWENDKIAFRTYGKAIEKTKEYYKKHSGKIKEIVDEICDKLLVNKIIEDYSFEVLN